MLLLNSKVVLEINTSLLSFHDIQRFGEASCPLSRVFFEKKEK